MQARKDFAKRCRKIVLDNWQLYLFLLPALAAVFIFSYMPMYGIQLAFRDYVLGRPINSGKWVGLRHFRRFFNNMWCWPVIRNTVRLSVGTMLLEFPLPILLALLLHNCPSRRISKLTQTVTYIPHLISVVVTVSILNLMVGNEAGMINLLLQQMGLEKVNFIGSERWFFWLYLISNIWSGVGYSAIIYLAALSGVDAEIVEAAQIDGVNRLQKVWYVDLPQISGTIITLLIMRCGSMFSVGQDKVLLMQNNLNLSVSEVISTYVYKTGVLEMQFGFSTAIGLLNNVVNFATLCLVNFLAARLSDTSIL